MVDINWLRTFVIPLRSFRLPGIAVYYYIYIGSKPVPNRWNNRVYSHDTFSILSPCIVNQINMFLLVTFFAQIVCGIVEESFWILHSAKYVLHLPMALSPAHHLCWLLILKLRLVFSANINFRLWVEFNYAKNPYFTLSGYGTRCLLFSSHISAHLDSNTRMGSISVNY